MVRSVRHGLVTCCVVINFGLLSTAWAQSPPLTVLAQTRANKQAYRGLSLEQLKAIEPLSPNPYLSFLPATHASDTAYWQARMRAEAFARRAAQARGAGSPTVEESEPNNAVAMGNPVSNFGNTPGQIPATDVTGDFPEPPVTTPIGPFLEDNGAIPLASTAELSAGQRVTIMAKIGNGPHGSFGSGRGDFDFYEISGVTAGQLITADVNTDPDSPFDSFLALWDSAGNLIALNDDDLSSPDSPRDSFVLVTAPTDDTYYVSVGSFESQVPQNPFDSSSGPGFGSEGDYELSLGINAYDVDFFAVPLNAGDILNVNGIGAISHVSLFDPSGVELITSDFDITPILPVGTPFAAGDNPSLVYIIDQPGTYGVRVVGVRAGIYLTELRTARSPLEMAEPGATQILFIDFDGEVVETSRFGGFGRRLLSPLRLFLDHWGLDPADENGVIDAILTAVEENLQTDIMNNGNNPQFDIEIRNSRDHDDPFGDPHVSRVIVGGTIAESGIDTIGIAESIDIGNFNATETALVLLDVLSAPNGDPSSMNTFRIDPTASMIDLIGIGVGNIVAHEAGHFFGNFHTDQLNLSANIMDQGGNLPNTLGIGQDHIFGTQDDVDVDFGLDQYVPNEGFMGIEDTLNVIAFGLSSMPTDLTTTSH